MYGMGEMSAKEFNFFRKWIMLVAKEMAREKQEVFSKNYRATLYKQ